MRRAAALGASLGLGAAGTLATVRSAHAVDYKALVCIFLYGGNDGNNTIVPTDAALHAQYASVRGALALPRGALLPLSGTNYGLHPALASLMPAWGAGQLAPLFNVGPLYAPLTKEAYRSAPSSSRLIPDRLFSHSDQQALWEASAVDATERTGWGGRAAQTMATTNPVISAGGNARFGLSPSATPLVLPDLGGSFGAYSLQASDVLWEPYRRRKMAIDALYAQGSTLALEAAYQSQQRDAFVMSERLNDLVRREPGAAGGNPALDAAFAPIMSGGKIATPLGRQLYQIAKMIDGRAVVQGSRQIFFAQLDGFDTHGAQVDKSASDGPHARLLQQLGDAMACFHAAMAAIGMSDAVTQFTQSDFGRTFKPNNSLGTDHGWGNHQWVMGGAVRGQRTYGTYPTLVLGGPDDVGVEAWEQHGRWIPTTSVDQYAATLLSWFGADPGVLDTVLPNLRNFGNRTTLGFV